MRARLLSKHTWEETNGPARGHFWFYFLHFSYAERHESIGMESGCRWKLPLKSKLELQSLCIWNSIDCLQSTCFFFLFLSFALRLRCPFTYRICFNGIFVGVFFEYFYHNSDSPSPVMDSINCSPLFISLILDLNISTVQY